MAQRLEVFGDLRILPPERAAGGKIAEPRCRRREGHPAGDHRRPGPHGPFPRCSHDPGHHGTPGDDDGVGPRQETEPHDGADDRRSPGAERSPVDGERQTGESQDSERSLHAEQGKATDVRIEDPPQTCCDRRTRIEVPSYQPPQDEARGDVGRQEEHQREPDRRRSANRSENRPDENPVERVEARRKRSLVELRQWEVAGQPEVIERVVGQGVADQRRHRREEEVGNRPGRRHQRAEPHCENFPATAGRTRSERLCHLGVTIVQTEGSNHQPLFRPRTGPLERLPYPPRSNDLNIPPSGPVATRVRPVPQRSKRPLKPGTAMTPQPGRTPSAA